ncbi:MAG: TetR/AcrR family transcriptional regulator [Bacillota bacterium]
MKKGVYKAKREQILLAAARSFLDRDFTQVKIEEIAAAAGVGKGTVYEYFNSKEELFIESVTDSVEPYILLFNQFYKTSTSCRENLRSLLYVQFQFLRDNPNTARFLYNERPVRIKGLEQWFMDRRLRLVQAVEGLITQGIKDGELRPAIDTALAARCFHALVFAVLGGMQALDGIEIMEEHIDQLLDLFWKGVGANA